MESYPGLLMAEIGLPPGFAPIVDDLDQLIVSQQISRYEIRRRAILLYFSRLNPQDSHTLAFRLMARVSGELLSPPSEVYSYYMPEVRSVSASQRLAVEK